ncbi:MAG: hypothetical protein ACE5FM_04900 [Methyloligellaceae bacterium]
MTEEQAREAFEEIISAAMRPGEIAAFCRRVASELGEPVDAVEVALLRHVNNEMAKVLAAFRHSPIEHSTAPRSLAQTHFGRQLKAARMLEEN